MTYDEELLQEAYECGIEVIDKFQFKSPRIKGLYCNNVIALSDSIQTRKEASCVLTEELCHHYITVGDIIDQNVTENRKQENKARFLAYNRKIGLTGIIRAYEVGCLNLYEMSEFLDTTEEFLREALENYKSKYGEYVRIDNYVVSFEPTLGVLKFI